MGKAKKGWMLLIASMLAIFLLAGCNSESSGSSGGTSKGKGDKIVVGFSQIGAESGWRTAETDSIKKRWAMTPNLN